MQVYVLCFLASFDSPPAQTCLLPSEPVIHDWRSSMRKCSLSASGGPCLHSYSVPPSSRMTRSSHVPVILGETERSVLGLGVWGAWGFWMLLTKKHVCYNCPNHLQPSRFGSDNVQLGGQCLQLISVGSRIWLYQICLIGEHFWPKIFLKIVSA